MGNNNLLIISMLAWRNVWKNKRRTIMTLLTAVIGCISIVFTFALGKGMYEQMIEYTVAKNLGHIQVQTKGSLEDRDIKDAFIPDDRLIKAIENDRDIEAYSKRINAAGMIIFKDTVTGVMVQGIDPEKDKSVSNIYKSILPGGRFLKTGDSKQIVIGEALAKNIGIKIGEKLLLKSQMFDGSIAVENLTVAGLYNAGLPELDAAFVIMPMRQAAETFGMNDRINSIVIRTKKIDAVYDARERLLKNIDPSKIDILGWKELVPLIAQNKDMDGVGRIIVALIMYVVIAFSVLNTIQMSAYNRTREFGVMLAIGTKPCQIKAMIMFESLYISVIGVILGGLLSAFTCNHFYNNPLQLGMGAKDSNEMASALGTAAYPNIPTIMTWESLITALTIILTLSLLLSLIPARKAARLKPVQSIGHL